MPDKQNENKFMAMLERRGIVRKVGEEDDLPEEDTGNARPRPEADLRSLFGATPTEATKVTPASRQPVPGMPNPVISPEQPKALEREQRQPVGRVEPIKATAPERAEPEASPPPKLDEPKQPPPEEREEPVETGSLELKKPPSLLIGVEPFSSGDDFDEEPDAGSGEALSFGAPTPPPEPPKPPVENYTERYLDIEELFEVLDIKAKRTESIYLVEDYIKTLPDSLPDESRRDIISKLVEASGFDYDRLMGDGVLRVRALKEYAERFAQYTEDHISARQREIDELEQQILRIRRLIENRRELHKKQFFAIEAEAQRLKEILEFISG